MYYASDTVLRYIAWGPRCPWHFLIHHFHSSTHLPIYLFFILFRQRIYSFILSLISPFTYSFTHSSIYSLIYFYDYSLICLLIICSFSYSIVHSLIYWSSSWFIHSLNYIALHLSIRCFVFPVCIHSFLLPSVISIYPSTHPSSYFLIY